MRKNAFFALILLCTSLFAKQLTFVTYNLRVDDPMGLGFQQSRIDNLSKVIANADADVVAVQEVSKGWLTNNFNTLKSKTGMSGVWYDIAGDGYGIGLLWKSSLGTPQTTNVKIDRGSESSDKEDRAYIVAEFDDFVYYSAHYSLNADDRDAMGAHMINRAQTHNKTVFVGADFNAQPTYRVMQKLQSNGFAILNNTNTFTFPASSPTTCIDMILGYRKDSNSKSYSVISTGIPQHPSGVLMQTISDHLPVAVTIELDGTEMSKEIVVTANSGTGAGTLPAAIDAAQDGDVITFNLPESQSIVTTAAKAIPVGKIITIDGTNRGKTVTVQTSSGSVFTGANGANLTLKNISLAGGGTANTALVFAAGSTLNLEACEISGFNSGSNNGGVARIQGTASIKGCVFRDNIAEGSYGGGAILVYNAANVVIEGSTFIGNRAVNTGNNLGGGAICLRGTNVNACRVRITNCTFSNNCGNYGGALLVTTQGAFNTEVDLINCTFTGNRAANGGAISTYHSNASGSTKLNIVNSIATNNFVGTLDKTNSTVSGDVKYNDIANCGTATGAELKIYNTIYGVSSKDEVVSEININAASLSIDASSQDIPLFEEYETQYTTLRRPKLSDTFIPVTQLATSSIADNKGVSSLAGFIIPEVDQVETVRDASTPTIGSLEYFESRYTINATAENGGTVSGSGEYAINSIVTLLAIPISGYSFEGWYNGNVKIDGAESEYSFTVTAATAAINYVAKFVLKTGLTTSSLASSVWIEKGRVRVASQEPTQVSVFSVAGQQVAESEISSNHLICLNKGVYVLRVRSEKEIFTDKIVLE